MASKDLLSSGGPIYYVPISAKLSLQKKTKKNTRPWDEETTKKHIFVAARANTVPEAQALNQTLTVLGTRCEYPLAIALPKDVMREREKTEEHFLKGVFAENFREKMIEAERFRRE